MSSAVSDILLQDAGDALRRRLMAAVGLSSSDRAFLAWALRDDSPAFDLTTLGSASASTFMAARSYQDVAAMGYALHVGRLDDAHLESFRAGLRWLCGRNAEIDGEPAPFFTDAVTILGVAIGAATVGLEDAAAVEKWLLEFVPRAATLPAVEPWQRCLFAIALQALGSTEVSLPVDTSVADVRTALRARSMFRGESRAADDADERLTLAMLKQQVAEELAVARAALRLAAFSWIQRSAPVVVPGRATIPDLVKFLEGVPAGLRRWAWEEKPRTKSGEARKWHVDHEYHVQDLLYFLLAPVFPDIKDEEYVSSLGQKQPRTDLFIPSLKAIVEVKFLRAGEKFQKVIDEVAADASLYLRDGSDYVGLVAFVWDDSRRTEEHPLLRNGLLAIRGVVGAVVVPRPGRMT